MNTLEKLEPFFDALLSLEVGCEYATANELVRSFWDLLPNEKSPDYYQHAALGLKLAGQLERTTKGRGKLGNQQLAALHDISYYVEAQVALGNKSSLSTLGWSTLYSALREGIYLSNSDLASRAVQKIKNNVLSLTLDGGRLTSGTERQKVDYEILLASIPFGLFEPEDLVLVEAATELSKPTRLDMSSTAERALFAWYEASRGNYLLAQEVVRSVSDTSEVALVGLANNAIKKETGLKTPGLRHVPTGNGNRYHPLACEREPHRPKTGEKIRFFVEAEPLSTKNPVAMVIDNQRVMGELDERSWRFEYTSHKAQERTDYWFEFVDYPKIRTETYHLELMKQEPCGNILGWQESADGVLIFTERACLNVQCEVDGAIKLTSDFGRHALDEFCPESPNDLVLGEVSVRICKKTSVLEFGFRDYPLVTISTNDIVKQKMDDQSVGWIVALKNRAEVFIGGGERYNAFNQIGNTLDCYVFNQYKDQGIRTYLPIPVVYSDAGFGVFLSQSEYSELDLGETEAGTLYLRSEASEIDIMILFGTVREQIRQYVHKTGPAKAVPSWVFGPWMSSNNWDSEAEVDRQIEFTKKHGIPASTLVIEAWSDEATYYLFNDSTLPEQKTDSSQSVSMNALKFPEWGRWPDPGGLVERMHADGIRCVLWQIPVLKQVPGLMNKRHDEDVQHALANGFVVTNADGTPYKIPEGWFKGSYVPDFTNQAAKDWWFANREYLLSDIGVDGFKTDGGECIFGDNLRFHDGSLGKAQRNNYPMEYLRAYHEFAEGRGKEIITFSRAGYTGAQTVPTHWAGDEISTWDALTRTLFAGMSASISGVFFWGWDLGGFSGDIPSAELFVRATQLAAFCPIMQYHAESKAEENQDRTPWNIATRTNNELALTNYVLFANLRMNFVPYLEHVAAECVTHSLPMLRPLYLEYDNDQKTAEIVDQFMLGKNLLVAPIIEPGCTERLVYLPESEWWSLFEAKWYSAGEHLVRTPLSETNVFLRRGAIIPLAFEETLSLGSTMPCAPEEATDLVFLCVGELSSFEMSENSIEVVFSDGSKKVVSVDQRHWKRILIASTEQMDSRYFEDLEPGEREKLSIFGRSLNCRPIEEPNNE
jgi:alpha-glucosidase (family GH31 glycosyl hydrolase)